MKKRNWRLMLRRVLNLVFSRIVVTGVLLLLQAFWLFALFYWLADYAKLVRRRGRCHERYHVPGADPAGFHGAGV